MDIRNRMPDVVKLRCNTCQEFLKLVIQPGWQQALYNKASEEVEGGKYRDRYKPTYEKMRDKGVDNYSIEDMDITMISAVLYDCKSIVSVSKQTQKAMKQLTEDRNITNHSSENEETEELYSRALMSLRDLKSFVQTVDQFETEIDGAKRCDFRRKSIQEIERLMNVLDEERIQNVQRIKDIDRDVQEIKNSDDPFEKWMAIYKIYMDRWKVNKQNREITWEFEVRASDAGIPYAHRCAADYFYIIKKDIDECIRRLTLAFQSSKTNNDAIVADFTYYVNRHIMAGNEMTEDMIKLLDCIRLKGFRVSKSDAGYYQIEKERGSKEKSNE